MRIHWIGQKHTVSVRRFIVKVRFFSQLFKVSEIKLNSWKLQFLEFVKICPEASYFGFFENSKKLITAFHVDVDIMVHGLIY